MIITALHKSSKIQLFLPKSREFDIFLFNSYFDNDKLSVTYTVGIGDPNTFSSHSPRYGFFSQVLEDFNTES